jgi:hypothetical protein
MLHNTAPALYSYVLFANGTLPIVMDMYFMEESLFFSGTENFDRK